MIGCVMRGCVMRGCVVIGCYDRVCYERVCCEGRVMRGCAGIDLRKELHAARFYDEKVFRGVSLLDNKIAREYL